MSNITRYRGDTVPIPIRVINPSGSIRNIDGETFLLTVSGNEDPLDTGQQIFQSTGSIIGASNLGRVDFPLTTEQADNLGRYYFDIQLTAADSTIMTIGKGVIIFDQDITK